MLTLGAPENCWGIVSLLIETEALTWSHTPMRVRSAEGESDAESPDSVTPTVTSETPIRRALSMNWCSRFAAVGLSKTRALGSGRAGWVQANSGLSTSMGMS